MGSIKVDTTKETPKMRMRKLVLTDPYVNKMVHLHVQQFQSIVQDRVCVEDVLLEPEVLVSIIEMYVAINSSRGNGLIDYLGSLGGSEDTVMEHLRELLNKDSKTVRGNRNGDRG
jgi:hypothetical protein